MSVRLWRSLLWLLDQLMGFVALADGVYFWLDEIRFRLHKRAPEGVL